MKEVTEIGPQAGLIDVEFQIIGIDRRLFTLNRVLVAAVSSSKDPPYSLLLNVCFHLSDASWFW